MNLYFLLPLITGIWFLFIGSFIFWKNKRSLVNITFALECLCCSIWLFGYAAVYTTKNYGTAVILIKLFYCGIIFIPTFFWHFTTEFLQHVRGVKKQKWDIIIPYTTSFIFVILLFTTNNFIAGAHKYFWGYYAKAGFVHSVFLFFFPATWFFNIFRLYIGYKEEKSAVVANRIKYAFLAFLIGSPGMLDFTQNYGLQFYPFGFIFVATAISIFAYAIVRHQLLDIEVIIKKTLVFAGLLASVFAMLLLPTLVIQEYIFRGTGTGGRMIGLTISGIIIMLALRRIENFLINVTDKFLFQKKYDYKELLKTFTSEVLTVLDLNRLVRLTVSKLSDIIKLQSCGILLLDEDKGKYDLVASQGIKERNIALGAENTLITFLSRAKTYLSVKPHEKELQMPQEIIEDMNKLKFELAIPLLTLQGDMVGILTLGKKKSDEDYTQDDMDIIVPLARTLAIAINNAQMFDELGKTQAEAAQKEKMAVIGTLSAGINHEICNPLGIARGQCEAFLLNIKDGLYKNKTEGELLEKAQSIMGKVIHETDRATAITKRLSSFAKPSKGVISANINVKDEIDEVLALVGYELKLDKIDIVKDIEKNLPLLTGDKKQLQEVFFNLVRNAAQAIKEKGRITIKAREADGKISIEIEDTGHGIPENKLEQIFNPFYTTKEPGKGTGLGLFIVRQVVERNRGKISVKSKVNEGTTFMLEFPIKVKSKA